MTEEMIAKFDTWLKPEGPAALVLREYLMPIEGPDGVFFPATFAASEDKSKGGYNIDELGDGQNVCLVDSVGSQANRMEPIFAEEKYADLVPQVVVKAGNRSVNLVQAGHRAGDAIVRCSELQETLRAAFLSVLAGNVEPLAKIAPTSIVFGAWDSRDTQAKLPRIVASTIRAFNVKRLTRSAQYIPAIDYIGENLLDDTDDKKTKDAYAAKGFIHVPASGSPGGVIATGHIRRDASLHLSVLRTLNAENDVRAIALRRYILGLSLVALTYSPSTYLRQGCNLVLNPEKKRECYAIYPDGHAQDVTLSHGQALEYAQVTAKEFGVGESRSVRFLPERAKADVSDANTKPRAGKGKRKAE